VRDLRRFTRSRIIAPDEVCAEHDEPDEDEDWPYLEEVEDE
jgi:hypothetical protein